MPRTLRDDDRGQGLSEYGLILGFVAVVCIAALVFLGQSVLGHYQTLTTQYP